METIVVQPLLFLFCTGIVIPAKPSDVPGTPCENPLTEKNLVNTIQKELDRDGGYSEEVAGKTVEHKGMDLNYFGARYYDPVIGYWISLDRMEQFWSGYSYGEPINSIDPDGNFKTINMIKEDMGDVGNGEFAANNNYCVKWTVVHRPMYQTAESKSGKIGSNYVLNAVVKYASSAFIKWPSTLTGKIGLWMAKTLAKKQIEGPDSYNSRAKPWDKVRMDAKIQKALGTPEFQSTADYTKFLGQARTVLGEDSKFMRSNEEIIGGKK